MKTREQLYNGEGAEILNILNTYHTLHYEQILRLFEKNTSSIKALITRLTKQGAFIMIKGKIYYAILKNLQLHLTQESSLPFGSCLISRRPLYSIQAVTLLLSFIFLQMMNHTISFMYHQGKKL